MTEALKKIMDAACPAWGVCRFEELSQNLLPCRAAKRLPEGAASVITALFPYLLDDGAYTGLNVSRYAAPADYHDVVTSRLSAACDALAAAFPGESFVCFADNSPVPEVDAAVKSGLGVKGDNSLLINSRFGSFVFIGEIVTTLVIPPAKETAGGCLHCGRCAAACPSKAIEGGRINTAKCLSAVTQQKGELTAEEKRLIRLSGCAWGCDICQNVCPLNAKAEKTGIEEFAESCVPRVLPGCTLEGRAYAWRGQKVIERNLNILFENQP